MKKLLLALSFILLASPALADHIVLQDSVEYTDHVVTCSTYIDAIQFSRSLDLETLNPGQPTKKALISAADEYNCDYSKRTFFYNESDYVCGFSVMLHNFTILHIHKANRLKFYLITNATVAFSESEAFVPCIPA